MPNLTAASSSSHRGIGCAARRIESARAAVAGAQRRPPVGANRRSQAGHRQDSRYRKLRRPGKRTLRISQASPMVKRYRTDPRRGAGRAMLAMRHGVLASLFR
jgi:hypothetical protein